MKRKCCPLLENLFVVLTLLCNNETESLCGQLSEKAVAADDTSQYRCRLTGA